MKPDKVGVYDNSLPIDQLKYKWLGDELVRLAKKQNAPDSHLSTFTMEEFRSQFAAAGERLGVDALHPYQLRHGGATDDLTSKSRDFPAVKPILTHVCSLHTMYWSLLLFVVFSILFGKAVFC